MADGRLRLEETCGVTELGAPTILRCKNCNHNFVFMVVKFEIFDGLFCARTFCPHCGIELGLVPI